MLLSINIASFYYQRFVVNSDLIFEQLVDFFLNIPSIFHGFFSCVAGNTASGSRSENTEQDVLEDIFTKCTGVRIIQRIIIRIEDFLLINQWVYL